MFLSALAAAALALLISGDVARLGGAAFSPWHVVFPYLSLFLLLQALKERRRVEDGEVFLAGAAMAMLYGGVYAKDLQHGLYPFGIDWIGTLGYGFDGGMTAVLALHVRDAVPRLKTLNQDGSAPARCAILLIILAGAACVYGVNTVFKFYRAQRSLGPTWLLGDILFASAAWALAARAKASAEREEPAASRELWIWGVAGFVVWLPVARVIARTCAATGLPDALLYFFVGAWTAAAGWAFWRLWLTRGRVDPAPVSRSRFALAAALGRALGAAAVALSVGWDARSGGVFALLIDLPTHALFAWAFLTSRLEV